MKTDPNRRYGEVRDGRIAWVFNGAQLPEYNPALAVVDLTDHPDVNEGWIVDGTTFVPPTDRPRVPDSITMRQASEPWVNSPRCPDLGSARPARTAAIRSSSRLSRSSKGSSGIASLSAPRLAWQAW